MEETDFEELMYGKLPGRKDWALYYVELYPKLLRVFEGNDSPRKHVCSLEIRGADSAGEDGKGKKRDFRFYYEKKGDGKYLFRCVSPEKRQAWIMSLQRQIQKQGYIAQGLLSDTSVPDSCYSLSTSHTPIPCDIPRPPPHSANRKSNSSPRMSTSSKTPPPPPPHKSQTPKLDKRDSGFVSGTGEMSRMSPRSNSGGSTVVHRQGTALVPDPHRQSHSADGAVVHSTQIVEDSDMTRYGWYWGFQSRSDCAAELKERGKVGNFVVRLNDRGDYVMSFWRKDGIHHHKIQKNGELYSFERTAVRAEGYSIPDLLDTYMKHCTDKTIGPFGGQLYPDYATPWSPPEIDFDKFGSTLKNIKEKNYNKPVFSGGPGMGGRYGGKSLHEMKVEMDEEASGGSTSSLNDPEPVQPHFPEHKTSISQMPKIATPFAGFVPGNRSPRQPHNPTLPTPVPAVLMKHKSPQPEPVKLPQNTAASVERKKKKQPVPPPSPKPKPGGRPYHNERLPTTHEVDTRSSDHPYTNFNPHTQEMEREKFDNDSDEDRDSEEEYVNPHEIMNNSVYQNVSYDNQNGSDPTHQEHKKYVNLPIPPSAGDQDGLYANVSYDNNGRPRPAAPPRNMRRYKTKGLK